jgi:hypothetical protein
MDALPFSRIKLAALIAAGATLAATASKTAAAHETVQATASGPLGAIAASPGRLFALSGLEVLTFDDDGQPLGRCAGFAAPPQSERRAPIGAPDADEVLRAAGLDDDDSPAAEEALEDEGLGPKRRPRPRPESGILPRALAPDARADGAVWIATSSGIFRGDEHGCLPAGLDGRDLLFVAAAGSTVVAATEDLLFRWAGDPDASDTGYGAATFTVAAGLAELPRALALGADGAAIVADDDGLLVIGGDGGAARILDRPVDALAVCGGEALALANDGVYRWTPGALPARTADRPPIRGIACGPTRETRWIGTGLGVWTSPDGTAWTERAEKLGRSVAGAATAGPRTWLAIDNTLIALDLTAPPRAPSPIFRFFQSTAAIDATAMAPLTTARLEPTLLPWPEVTALFGAERRTPDRRGWEVMLLLTFPFDRIAHRRVDPTFVAAERARRDAALAREQIDLATRSDDQNDDDDDDPDERDARLETVLQEREALR